MKNYLRALSFLTTISFPSSGLIFDGRLLAASAAAFPLVGATIGLILAGAAHLLLMVLPPLPVTALILTLSFLITRGLHLDGLADTADGLIGTFDRERAFKAMKDSAVGVTGAVAVMLTLLIKLLIIAEINTVLVPAALLFMSLTGRWAIVYGSAWFKPAKEEGLGSLFFNGLNYTILLKASLGALAVIALVVYFIPVLLVPVAGGCAAALLAAHLIALYGAKRLGGLTGDILGALSELGEMFFLIGFVIALNATKI